MPMDLACPQTLLRVRPYHLHGLRLVLARNTTNAWPDQSLPALVGGTMLRVAFTGAYLMIALLLM